MIFLFSQKETTGTASHANCTVRLLRHYCLLLGHNTDYFHPYFAIIVPPFVVTMSFIPSFNVLSGLFFSLNFIVVATL